MDLLQKFGERENEEDERYLVTNELLNWFNKTKGGEACFEHIDNCFDDLPDTKGREKYYVFTIDDRFYKLEYVKDDEDNMNFLLDCSEVESDDYLDYMIEKRKGWE